MSDRPGISRRGFMTTAALGAAAAAVRFPSGTRAESATKSQPADDHTPGPALLKLDRNESSYGLAPAAAIAAQAAISGLSYRYPVDEPKALIKALAERYGVDKEMVAVGCGSVEILKMATESFCSVARPAVVAEPTFEAVVSYSQLMHSHAAKVPLTREHKHDLHGMLRHARAGAGMVFLCNPSNPAGTYVGKREVESFVRRLPHGVVLLSDEAYQEYVTAEDYESCLRYVKEGLPVVVSRTFSKIYGMAGLRVGYAIGRKDLIERMTKRRLANNPNQIATAAALAALKQDGEHVARVKALNASVREYMYAELTRQHLPYIPTETNFVMIQVNRPVEPMVEAFKKRSVMVGRLFPSMPTHLRVGLGTREEMERFMKELLLMLGSDPA